MVTALDSKTDQRPNRTSADTSADTQAAGTPRPASASCFYVGTVWHRRGDPVKHEFRYQLFFPYVDLAELDTLFGRPGLWSSRFPALAWFRRKEHLGDPKLPLDAAVRQLVEERCGFQPNGPIRLLTNFRYFGFQMNPVSFYYCYDRVAGQSPSSDELDVAPGNHSSANQERLVALVAEVSNTPWNEQHCYVLDLRQVDTAEPSPLTNQPVNGVMIESAQAGSANDHTVDSARHADVPDSFTAETRKVFHVSPFMNLDMTYDWQFNVPGETLKLLISNRSDTVGKMFDASITLHRVPITPFNKLKMLARFPFMTVKVFLAIYVHALLLWLKRVPYVPHP